MKKTIGVLFGGQSNEHEVSINSAINLMNGINKEKYNVVPIHITKKGEWAVYKNIEKQVFHILQLEKGEFTSIENIDLIFPVIHGETGEDGKLQGFFETVGIPYIGCQVESSAIGMNKFLSKLLAKQVIDIVPYELFRKEDFLQQDDKTFREKKWKFPLFVKPNRAGSSVGATKVSNVDELYLALRNAFEIDNEVLVEQFLKIKELEVGVFERENETVVSQVGHISYTSEFYDYESKYLNDVSTMIIPAQVNDAITSELQEKAKALFKLFNCKDYARIDFFYDESENKLYFNEINTSPGMTDKSMFPVLFNHMFTYEQIVEYIIERNIIHDETHTI